jgi:hypothetical protein
MLKAKALVTSAGNSIDSYFEITPEVITETDINGKTVEVPTGDFNYTLKEDLPNEIKEKYKDLDVLIKRASERSYFTKSFLSDAVGIDEGTAIPILERFGFQKTRRKEKTPANFLEHLDGGLNTVSALSAIMFNQGERFNRQVSLLASYELELNKLTNGKPEKATTEQKVEAADKAMYLTTEYNGGAVVETGARVAQQGVGRTMFMYKNYGLGMHYSMFKVLKQSVGAAIQYIEQSPATKKEKAERRRNIAIAANQAIAAVGASTLLAGVQGAPLYGAVALMYDLMFAEDDEPDFDTVVRNYLTETWYKGPLIEMLGVDYSQRVRLNTLLFQENRYYHNQSPEEFIFQQFAGPAVNIGLDRIPRAVKDLNEGNIERGIEGLLPTGLSNIYKYLHRLAKEDGFATRRGDPIYSDLTSGDVFAGTMGFLPAAYTATQEASDIKSRISKAVSKERTKLLSKLYAARRFKDRPEQRKILAEIRAFNKKHPSARITREVRKRSYEANVRTTKSMVDGVVINPLMAKVLETERNRYGDKFYDFLD